MKHLRSIVVLVLAAPVGAATASDHIVDIHWSNEGRFQHRSQVAAGKFVEVCGKLALGSAIRWSFDASAALDFNVHYHVGKDVVFPFKLTAVASATDTLDAKIEQEYCWTWRNKSAETATVTVRLQR